MDIIPLFEHFLYQVSSALYLPVIASVTLLSLYVLWLLGALIADGWLRLKRGSDDLVTYKRSLQGELERGGPHLDARLERLLQQAELAISARLDRVRFVIKVGPALGLMGTLIPMGISLAALAEGNIPKMAGSMVTAFTATVAGLGCGVVAYLIAMVREKWARADVREMEFVTEIGAREADQPLSATYEEDDLAISAAPQAA